MAAAAAGGTDLPGVEEDGMAPLGAVVGGMDHQAEAGEVLLEGVEVGEVHLEVDGEVLPEEDGAVHLVEDTEAHLVAMEAVVRTLM
jgi:hypothetical protein